MAIKKYVSVDITDIAFNLFATLAVTITTFHVHFANVRIVKKKCLGQFLKCVQVLI